MNPIHFSVVTRTKNRNDLLLRNIKSVSSQSYENFTHIILNDGGDKDAVDNLLPKKNAHIKVIHNKESVGIVAALNQAIRTTDKDTYIVILDDDDSWHKDRLKDTAAFIEKSVAKVVAVKMDVVIETVENGETKELKRFLHEESGDGEISLYKQCIRNYLSNGAIAYHRSLYDELNGYDESLPTAEDWDFGIRLLQKYDVPLLRTGESLVYYHQRPEAVGDLGNSVSDGVGTQEYAINLLRNRYLRQDMKKGTFGPGYIMNAVPYDERMVRRLEAHINLKFAESVAEMKGFLEHHLWQNFGKSVSAITRDLVNKVRRNRN